MPARSALLSFFIYALTLCSVAVATPEAPTVRVLVASEVSELGFSVKGPFRITAKSNGAVVVQGKQLPWRKVRSLSEAVLLGPDRIEGPGIRIEAEPGVLIHLERQRFRGAVELIPQPGNRLLAVNDVNIEDYVAGVLYREMSPWWPLEAVKAQAIASRTFALYTKGEQATKTFHFRNDMYFQVYGGAADEKRRARRAIDATRGQVLTYRGKPFPAYFHATCGGKTEDANVLWKVAVPPLKGVTCRSCAGSPHYRWEQLLPLAEIQKRLELYAGEIGAVQAIEPIQRSQSGRVLQLRIIGTKATVTVSGKDFRQWMDPLVVRSTNFEVDALHPQEGSASLKGRGWGHGVGMCQWGAYFQAKSGKRVEEILAFYYPGAKVLSHYGTRGD